MALTMLDDVGQLHCGKIAELADLLITALTKKYCVSKK